MVAESRSESTNETDKSHRRIFRATVTHIEDAGAKTVLVTASATTTVDNVSFRCDSRTAPRMHDVVRVTAEWQ